MEAIGEVIDSCIRDGILAEFLSSHRAEVFEVLLTEYDEQRHIASEKESSREEGMQAGIRKGHREAAINLFVHKRYRSDLQGNLLSYSRMV